ncbi:MAG: TIGR01244 family sulfur transferase [Pseudomonadota bacterium]
MDLRQLSERFYVSPQISAEDLPEIAAAGVTCVLCNRPDAEVPPSHGAQAIQRAAEAHGLRFACVPLDQASFVPAVMGENHAQGAGSEDVVLAYCASGTRSCIAWALGQAGDMPAEEIIAAAAAQGYDVRHIAQALERPFVER